MIICRFVFFRFGLKKFVTEVNAELANGRKLKYLLVDRGFFGHRLFLCAVLKNGCCEDDDEDE